MQRSSVRIETPSMESIEKITDLWVELAGSQLAYDSHVKVEPNRSRMRQTISRHLASGDIFVAIDDELIGFVMYAVESNSLDQTTVRGFIKDLYVVPDRRNEGIGSALLEAGERALGEKGVETIALEVLSKNSPAREFYRKRGYESHRLTVEKPIENDTHSKDEQ